MWAHYPLSAEDYPPTLMRQIEYCGWVESEERNIQPACSFCRSFPVSRYDVLEVNNKVQGGRPRQILDSLWLHGGNNTVLNSLTFIPG